MSTDQTRTRPNDDVIAEAKAAIAKSKAAILGLPTYVAVQALAEAGLLVAELPPEPGLLDADWPVGTRLTDRNRCAILTDDENNPRPWCVYDGCGPFGERNVIIGAGWLTHNDVRGWTPVEDQPAADPARVLPEEWVAIDLSDIGTDELRRHHRSGSVIEGDGRGSVSSVFSGVLDDLIVCELERRGEAL